MIAALQSFVVAHPVLAVFLVACVFSMLVLLVACVVGLRQLPTNTLDEVEAPVTARDDLDAGARPTASQPLPWTRGGGNWWPIP